MHFCVAFGRDGEMAWRCVALRCVVDGWIFGRGSSVLGGNERDGESGDVVEWNGMEWGVEVEL